MLAAGGRAALELPDGEAESFNVAEGDGVGGVDEVDIEDGKQKVARNFERFEPADNRLDIPI